MIDIKKRVAQMKNSRELGRCVCSLKSNPFPCPCPFMIAKKICHCAGEEHEGYTTEEWAKYNIFNNEQKNMNDITPAGL